MKPESGVEGGWERSPEIGTIQWMTFRGLGWLIHGGEPPVRVQLVGTSVCCTWHHLAFAPLLFSRHH